MILASWPDEKTLREMRPYVCVYRMQGQIIARSRPAKSRAAYELATREFEESCKRIGQRRGATRALANPIA